MVPFNYQTDAHERRRMVFNRFARIFVSVACGFIPTILGTSATAQPPDPRSEVVAEPPNSAARVEGNLETDQSSGLEYLTRAPLHEAFAGPYDANPTPNLVVKKEPPEPIDELPPEYRPAGDDVTWIPGYWSWDDERTDFIWISGVWRDIPPQQRWIPGYWAEVSNGFQYISGFWANDQLAEVEYLPEPPESLEQGSASPSPGEDYFYVPGHWVYQSNDYQWQPGFWSQVQQDWVWVPSQYIWTPSGCVFQNGYWDYNVAHRGVVFTPVYFQQPVYQQRQYTYRPQYTVDTGLGLFVHLFVRPNYRQYYFGDYYGSSYANTYYPWSTRYQSNRYYDPFFASYRHRSRGGGNINFISWINNQHQLFVNNQQYRPARTISAQRDFLRTNRAADIDPSVLRLTSIGESLSNLVQSNGGQQGFQRLNSEEMRRFRNEIAPQRQLGRDRLKTEVGDQQAQGRQGNESKPANSPNAAGNVTADADANADRDSNRKVNIDAKVGENGRGRLRLPKVDRGRDAAEGNRPRDNTDRAKEESIAGRADRRDPKNDRLDNAANRSANEASEARQKAAAADNQPNEARRKNRDDIRNRINDPAAGAGGNPRSATERLRPRTPGNWPATAPRPAGRETPAPPGNRDGHADTRDAAANPDSRRVRTNVDPPGRENARRSSGRTPDRTGRPMQNRQPNVGGGRPVNNAPQRAERGGGKSKGNERAASPARSSGKGEPDGAKSSGKPGKEPKDK